MPADRPFAGPDAVCAASCRLQLTCSRSLGQASATLDAGVKIYSYRVDAITSEAYKLLGGLTRNAKKPELEAESEPGAEGEQGKDAKELKEKTQKKKKVQEGETGMMHLEKNPENLNKKVDTTEEVRAQGGCVSDGGSPARDAHCDRSCRCRERCINLDPVMRRWTHSSIACQPCSTGQPPRASC